MKAEHCCKCDGVFRKDHFVDQPLLTCNHCENKFCWRDYLTHECSGHSCEAVECMSCGHYIVKDEEKVFPIEGDPYCEKCFTERPWEKKAAQG